MEAAPCCLSSGAFALSQIVSGAMVQVQESTPNSLLPTQKQPDVLEAIPTKQRSRRRRTLPREPGLSPISRDLNYLNADQSVSTGFRPLSTRALRALELRDLNPVDTSWSAFNYYM